MRFCVFAWALFIMFMPAASADASTLQPLAHPAPEGVDIAFQLTDGRVLAQSKADERHWYLLKPDIKGNYVNGIWTRAADLPSDYGPFAFASAVLADGRVIVQGGEYNFGVFTLTNRGEIYDPRRNKWTALSPPPGWNYIGDSAAVVLPDGRYVIAEKLDMRMAALNPATMTWTALSTTGKNDFNSEEGLTLLPDGSLLTVDVKAAPHTERYVVQSGRWAEAGTTPVSLKAPPECCGCARYAGGCYYPPGETGPAILRPDGTVFATGGLPQGETSAHTAIYSPSQNTWKAAPDFPDGDDAGDNFAVLLPNGKVLVQGTSGSAYEFDGTNLAKQAVCTCGHSLMLLPTGGVLVGGAAVYRSSGGSIHSEWRPHITNYPATVRRGSTYPISGRQFNGLSQANAFGDELMTATNYPLVRITNGATKHVFYARTHHHSTMGVATGAAVVWTRFDVPASMETGASTLVVVANGIPSPPVSVTVN
jgi:Kelch motif